MSQLTAMTKVPVVLLDIANLSSAKHPQIIVTTEESLCTGAALQARSIGWSLKQTQSCRKQSMSLSKVQPCPQPIRH